MLVVGASRGIGKQVSQTLADDGPIVRAMSPTGRYKALMNLAEWHNGLFSGADIADFIAKPSTTQNAVAAEPR